MNQYLKNIFRVCLSMAIAIIPISIFGQIVDESTRIDTNLVLIDVLVTDRSGRPVNGLTAERFELFSDNGKQAIDSFSMGSAPISFGIVYDMHPTTGDRTRDVIESLREFKRELGPEDDIFLIAFDMRGQQAFDFVPTLEQFEKHLANPERRQLRSLYDAVYFASDKIRASRNQKRILLIISDSADHHSRHAFGEVQRKLATINTEVYAIVVDDNNDLGYRDLTHRGRDTYPFSTDASELDRAALLELTLKSGGSTYFGRSNDASQLQRIYKDIAAEMRSHYTLGFYPDVIDGKRHDVKVRLRGVANAKDLVLSYRTTYETARNGGVVEK